MNEAPVAYARPLPQAQFSKALCGRDSGGIANTHHLRVRSSSTCGRAAISLCEDHHTRFE